MPCELPIPSDGESQVEFALRFHDATKDEIPDAEKRSLYCFRQWRDVNGDDPETEICRERFPSKEFDERRDIAIFDEHETPKEKYEREDLVAIIKNQNRRIQSKVFCPLSDGHTSDDPKHPEPAVLGFCGPARLGMIADVNGGPDKFAIYHDEYHRKDAAPVLAQKRGRSIETWRIDARGQFVPKKKRFFSPVAALGSTLPRLDLPSAKYSRQYAGEDMERYEMAMAGGSNIFGPEEVKVGKGQKAMYGDDPMDDMDGDDDDAMMEDEDDSFPLGNDIKQVLNAVFMALEEAKAKGMVNDDRKAVEAVMTAVTNTDLWQRKLAELEQEGLAGSSAPSVPIPIEPMMPQPGTTPGGLNMPGAGRQAGTAPGAQGAFGAMPNQPPKPQKGSNPMSDAAKPEQAKYSNSASALEALQSVQAENEILKQAVADLRNQIDAERTERIQYSRKTTLSQLADEYEKVNVDKLLEQCKSLDDAAFQERVSEIKECYSRKPEAVRDFGAVAGVGVTKSSKGSVTAADIDSVVRYARTKGVSFEEALEVHKAGQAS